MKYSLLIILSLMVFTSCNETYIGYNKEEHLSSKGGYWGASRPYRLYSLNKLYYLDAFPYSYWASEYSGYGDKCNGETRVYAVKDTINPIYIIDRCFYLDRVFLSNDGEKIAYIINNLCYSGQECELIPIQFYFNGKRELTYDYEFISKKKIDTTIDIKGWLFIDYQDKKWLSANNCYLYNDELYVIVEETKEVLQFDINNGNLIKRIPLDKYLNNLKKIQYPNGLVEFKPIYDTDKIPDVNNKKSFKDKLADFLKVQVIPNHTSQNNAYKYYQFNLKCLISSKGKCISKEIVSPEYIFTDEADLYSEQINLFLDSITFSNILIPYDLDKWLYEEIIYLKKIPDKISKREKIQYDSLICLVDTFNGFYVPKDLSDCITQLNSMLDENFKERLKNGENSHFGLGMYLRNNWGLWLGTRLKCYFQNQGVYHPDIMSSVILETYRSHLNGEIIYADSIFYEVIKSIDEYDN